MYDVEPYGGRWYTGKDPIWRIYRRRRLPQPLADLRMFLQYLQPIVPASLIADKYFIGLDIDTVREERAWRPGNDGNVHDDTGFWTAGEVDALVPILREALPEYQISFAGSRPYRGAIITPTVGTVL
jgi:hypothetical protein